MFEELLKLVGDNTEAKAEITRLAGQAQNEADQNKATIESLTRQFNDIKTEKDAYLKGNQLVKRALGIDKINDEVVTQRLAELGNSKSSKELAEKIAAKDAEIEQIRAEADSKLLNYQVDFESEKALNSISETLTDDPILRNMFREVLAKNVGVSDGKVLPMQTIGDQRIPIAKDGKPIELSEYANQLLDGDYKAFKKTSIKQSAGPTGGGGSDQPKGNGFGGSEDERKVAVANMIKQG